FNVVIHWRHGGDAYQQLVAVDRITQSIAAQPTVAGVTGPTRPDGKAPAIDPATLQADFAKLPQTLKDAIRSGQSIPSGGMGGSPGGTIDPAVVGRYAATVSSIANDGQTATLAVTLKIDPYSAAALDAMAPIRAAARNAAQDAGLSTEVASVQLSGVTPQLADTRAANAHDTALIVPLVLLLVAIVLGLLLRSIVAPLYLLAAVTLNYFAALGISSLIFTRLQGEEGVSYATPLYTFIFLVALGADYTIFLMSRVREEAARRGLREGTAVAVSRTGGVITSAGLILAGTFLVLTTLPLRTLSDFGSAVAIGVLLDTFVVRGFLVPGIVVVLGKANWWPGKLPTVTADAAAGQPAAELPPASTAVTSAP
ncbi:MAG: MMPL family transporter, partial [Ktedonobacterales bacterium]|nr:MMPL family transporter [Ktedonobacterales bacterium]